MMSRERVRAVRNQDIPNRIPSGLGGGFIFSGVHNLPADMPASHLRAVLDAYRDGCRYE